MLGFLVVVVDLDKSICGDDIEVSDRLNYHKNGKFKLFIYRL